MQKTYILDTSVLIFDPHTFDSFPDSEIIIPIIVLSELDKLKKFPGEAGKNARIAIRLLDDISNRGDISVGVLLDNDALVRVDTTYINTNEAPYLGLGDPNYGDTQILACAINHWTEHLDHDVTLVTNDINLRIKAKARGIGAEAHDDKKGSTSDLYSGVQVICNPDAGGELVQNGFIDPRCFNVQLNLNEFAIFQDANGDEICIGRKTSVNKVKLLQKKYPWSLSPKNNEQAMLIDLILDKNIDLVTSIGQSGTGKTICTLASCLELVLNKRQYDKLLIFRPIQSLGQDLGYLPGELSDKLDPWFGAIIDGCEQLFGNKSSHDWQKDLQMYQDKGKIEFSSISHLRGRSIPNALIYVDECQNFSKHELKAILTRAGTESCIVLSGDIEQIDAPNLNAMDNGLTYVIEKFQNCEFAGHITLFEGVRSRLATLSSEIL